MASDLYSTVYDQTAVEQNEQNNTHGCGFTEPRWSSEEKSYERTTIQRIQETSAAHKQPTDCPWTQLKVVLDVQPVAPNHQVGAVWTVDQWKTVRWSEAVWQENKPDSYGGYSEIWEVEMVDSQTPTPVKFWYALYAENSQGVRVWDNNSGLNYEKVII
ncbi:hypothetical protein N836_02270 [Leptolyngbya sp. Heron Island J]|uniref:hypothetical protein n=1 Tax=Leptolyngbya sp. Heron Island J TaxID=1385935 RepID=UPI0003B9B45D|nr:hypothetical protein [Leptolyngbya sp. Heron Island J]ESA39135.1 hypothetical protein N836_02270 [Leptolyngbya sp. Heron Island J]